jgi:hypothetical protein
MRRRMTETFNVSHCRAHLRRFSFLRHGIERLLDLARNDKKPVQATPNDEAVQCPSLSRVALKFCGLRACMAVEINHEGHEEHEEFATQHRRFSFEVAIRI